MPLFLLQNTILLRHSIRYTQNQPNKDEQANLPLTLLKNKFKKYIIQKKRK